MQVTPLLKASTIHFVILDIPSSSAWWSFLGSDYINVVTPPDGLQMSGIFLDEYCEYQISLITANKLDLYTCKCRAIGIL